MVSPKGSTVGGSRHQKNKNSRRLINRSICMDFRKFSVRRKVVKSKRKEKGRSLNTLSLLQKQLNYSSSQLNDHMVFSLK